MQAKLVQHATEERLNFPSTMTMMIWMKLSHSNLHLVELQSSPSLLGLSNGHDDSLLIAALANDLIDKGYGFGTRTETIKRIRRSFEDACNVI